MFFVVTFLVLFLSWFHSYLPITMKPGKEENIVICRFFSLHFFHDQKKWTLVRGAWLHFSLGIPSTISKIFFLFFAFSLSTLRGQTWQFHALRGSRPCSYHLFQSLSLAGRFNWTWYVFAFVGSLAARYLPGTEAHSLGGTLY